MIENWVSANRPTDEEIEARLEKARYQLFERQIKVKEGKVPVMILLEGWGAVSYTHLTLPTKA